MASRGWENLTQADVDRRNAKMAGVHISAPSALAAKPAKYRNVKTLLHGRMFDSRGEASRDLELAILESQGLIAQLSRQVDFPCEVKTPFFPYVACIGDWRADWTYSEKQPDGSWTSIAEDFKGVRTQLFVWKRKHVEAQYGIQIRLTGRTK